MLEVIQHIYKGCDGGWVMHLQIADPMWQLHNLWSMEKKRALAIKVIIVSKQRVHALQNVVCAKRQRKCISLPQG